MLTVKQVSERIDVPVSTVNLYCRQNLFPNAFKETSPAGEYWQIPETDLEGFEKPKRGRPKSNKDN